MIRDHEILQSPVRITLEDSTDIETPDAWKHEISEPTVRVLPLVQDPDRSYRDGWCTYTYEHTQAPELEVICGGINTKTPKASAIWRQGHLLHFGFEPSPDHLNQNGQALLINSICYIARFKEDRPIIRTPSSIYSGSRRIERSAIDRLARNESRDLDAYLDWFLGEPTRTVVRGMDRSALANWYRETGGYLRADQRGKFVMDEQAHQFGVAPGAPPFISSAVSALAEGGESTSLARELLARYVPGGPHDRPASEWKRWFEENRDYLFFSDTAGCLWLIDSLAKHRGIPTEQFRGSARASLEPIIPQ